MIALRFISLCLLLPQVQAQTVNLLFFGDSLTEGVPHLNGEVDTYPFKVAQQIPGSTYVKLGYRNQPTDYLMTHLDGFLFGLVKTEYKSNVLVLWAGTNDCALETLDCPQPAYTRLTYIARAAHAAGWKVVVVTTIARSNWFGSAQFQARFPANEAALNNLIRNSREFDAIADPSLILSDPSDSSYFWDGCHLFPKGYQLVADLVVQAIKDLSATVVGPARPRSGIQHKPK